MKTLILQNPITTTSLQQQKLPTTFFLFNFPSLSREKLTTFPHISRQPRFPVIKASAYAGWDEFRTGSDSGESNRLSELLVSAGIHDQKHVFLFLLGFISAFAISRVRVSSIVVFPACVLVFGVGFLVGLVRGGHFGGFAGVSSVGRKRAKEEIFKVYSERLKGLLAFFDSFDGKVRNLQNDVQRAIDDKEIALTDLESYVSDIESIKVSALDARKVVEVTIDGGNENQKLPGRKTKVIGEVGVELLQFVGGLFGEKVVGSKPNKVKDSDTVKRSSVEGLDDGIFQVNSLTSASREGVLDAGEDDGADDCFRRGQGLTGKTSLDWNRERKIRITSENDDIKSEDVGGKGRQFFYGEEGYNYVNTRLRFVNNRHVSLEMDRNNSSDRDSLHDSVDFSVRFKHVETESSFVQEHMFKKSSDAHNSSRDRRLSVSDTHQSQYGEDRVSDMFDNVSSSSSSAVSADVLFDRYLTEANNLLKEAKECIRGTRGEEHAEIVLYKSAKLLSKAVDMKPMSLLAVGQLGNTCLLHGELKLKISRELRTILSTRDPLSNENRIRVLRGLDNQVLNREKIASVLVDVCEECEELLVEAGRKYRLALSIDGNDVRALYNWGLALSFRAELIADIGPEAAFDADKVFLAAIDKFNAIMSKGNMYLPDALFRWGVTLQHRSRLRPTRSKERVKLLEQARRLYEDALQLDSDNFQVREALSLCKSELNHRRLL